MTDLSETNELEQPIQCHRTLTMMQLWFFDQNIAPERPLKVAEQKRKLQRMKPNQLVPPQALQSVENRVFMTYQWSCPMQ